MFSAPLRPDPTLANQTVRPFSAQYRADGHAQAGGRRPTTTDRLPRPRRPPAESPQPHHRANRQPPPAGRGRSVGGDRFGVATGVLGGGPRGGGARRRQRARSWRRASWWRRATALAPHPRGRPLATRAVELRCDRHQVQPHPRPAPAAAPRWPRPATPAQSITEATGPLRKPLGRHRQAEANAGPHGGLRQPDLPTVGLDDRAGDRESESGAACRP